MGTRVNAVKNQYVVLVVIYNLINGKVKVDSDLQKFIGIDQRLQTRTYIKRLNSPTRHFIPCDSMAKTENLHNRKSSSILANFSIRGNACERVDYAAPPHRESRDFDCEDKHLHGLTISVRDENGDLFDFNHFPLEFELEIN